MMTPENIDHDDGGSSSNHTLNNHTGTGTAPPTTTSSSSNYTHDFVQLIFTEEGPLGMEIYRHGNGVLSVRGVASDGQADQICQSILLKPDVFEGATVVSINHVWFQESTIGVPLWKELRHPSLPKHILFCLPRLKRHERSLAWAAKQNAVGRGGIDRAYGVNKVFVQPHSQQQQHSQHPQHSHPQLQVEMVFTQQLLGIRVDNETYPDICKVENFAKHTEADQIARNSLLLHPRIFQNATIRAVNGRKYKSKDAMYDALRSTNRPKSILFQLQQQDSPDNNTNHHDTTTTTTTTATTATTSKSSLPSPNQQKRSLLFDIAQTLKPATEPQPQYLPTTSTTTTTNDNHHHHETQGNTTTTTLSPSSSTDENEINSSSSSNSSSGRRRSSSSSSTSFVKVFGKVATDMTHSVRHLTTLMEKNQMMMMVEQHPHHHPHQRGGGTRMPLLPGEEDEDDEEEQDHQFICI